MMMNNPLVSLMGLVKNGMNPNQILKQMGANDPQVRQAIQMMQGKTPQQLKAMAYNIAAERGVSVNDVARQLGINLPSDK